MAMRIYKLRSLEIEGFKSFADKTLIEFDALAGLNFLTGRNEVEPRLGANGAGKSSLWDALFWCLYGVSILGDRASDLTSWGKKRPSVTAAFEREDGGLFYIYRIGSPEHIEITANEGELGTPCSQAEIDYLMGLSKARFAQAVIFGQNTSMFFDLDIPSRGKLLDEALDLSLWSMAAEEAKARHAAEMAKAAEQARVKAFAAGKLASLPDPAALIARAAEWDAEREARNAALLREIDEAEARIKATQVRLDRQRAEFAKLPKPDKAGIDALVSDLTFHRNAKAEAIGRQRAAEAYIKGVEKPVCPSCHQPVDRNHFDRLMAKHVEEADVLAANLALTLIEIEKLERKHTRAVREYDLCAEDREVAKRLGLQIATELKAHEEAFESCLMRADRETNENAANPYKLQLDERARMHDAAELEEHNADAAMQRHEGKALLYAAWKTKFKEVRLFIIKRILLQLELDTANAASLLGIGDWLIRFTTESATKGGDIKHGVQIAITSPGSSGLVALPSGGEGQRIRLAINMGLSSLIQRMSGVRYDFEVWDEPSDGLSDEGIDDLLDCLRYRAQITDKAIWLTDHRTLSYAFDQVWTVVKGVDGSIVEKEKADA